MKIDISNNHFSGTIPEIFFQYEYFPLLKYFIVAHNSFSGTLPQSITTSVTLKYFAVSYNNLKGTVPYISNKELYYLDVSYNNLHGNYFEDTVTLKII